MTTTLPPRTGATSTRSARPSLADQRDRRRRSRRRLVRGVVAAALVLLVAAAVLLVYVSRVLDARAVAVSGARSLSTEQVVAAAAVPLGVPLARQRLDEIARRTTSLPQVAGATVTREWPHTVRVTVTEREPLLGVAQPSGYLVVDQSGVVFATVPTLPAGVVQVAVDPANRPLLVQLGAVVLALPEDVRDQVTTIEAATSDSIRLRTSKGVTIVWGDSSDTPLKAQVATALLAHGAKTSIDVSAPHVPAVR